MSALRDRYKLPPVMYAYRGKADIRAFQLAHSVKALSGWPVERFVNRVVAERKAV